MSSAPATEREYAELQLRGLLTELQLRGLLRPLLAELPFLFRGDEAPARAQRAGARKKNLVKNACKKKSQLY